MKNGPPFSERPISLEDGLRVTGPGFCLCLVYSRFLVVVNQDSDQVTRWLVAQTEVPAARVISSETKSISVRGC